VDKADATMKSNGVRRFTWLLIFIVPISVVFIVAALWRFSPLSEIASPERLFALFRERWTDHWWTVLLVIVVYLIANLLMFPNSILNIAVILGVGGFIGWLYAILGSLSAATVFFFAGHFWGMERQNASKYAGIPKIRKFLAKGGIAAVVAVHAIPTAPYGIVNSIIGTFDISYRDFIVGTFLGHLPGTLCLAIFGKQLKNLLDDPSPQNIALILLIVFAAGVLIFVLRRRLKSPSGDESEMDNPGSRA
jgi:uncharacterized membrane protein YdjX (TVP38/TMEM64 family)